MHKTTGIVLRPVKYGETSVIVTIFTALYGVQAYMVKGVRSQKATGNKAGLLQPGMLLDMVVYHYPQKTLQHIKEFSPSLIYQSIHEDVVKSAIALFSAEALLRLLPAGAPMAELFDFAFHYFVTLDGTARQDTANFPLFFIINCSNYSGYGLKEYYTPETPYLNLQEGGFTAHPPAAMPYTAIEDGIMLDQLLRVNTYNGLPGIEMGSAVRGRLLEWYIAFLQRHTQHMGAIKSLVVLQAILH